MNPQERKVIDDLFDKLARAERQAGPREPVAEAHIRSRIDAQPGASYLMAQTIVMQTHALEAAQSRLTALEEELARRPAGGGFLSGLFGGTPAGGDRGATTSTLREAGFGTRAGAQGATQAQRARAGGGFLAGAAQTAMGVAGGMLLGSMIGGFFGGGDAHAAPRPDSAPDVADDEPTDENRADDAGSDFGGDFDSDET